MTIRIVPLGGLGEIGMNCMAVELGTPGQGPVVVVDCGVMFPNVENGVDVIHPDFDYLEVHRDRLAALLVTHGHEDHIGAIPYLARRFDVPIYAPPYALGLIRERMKEHLAADPRRREPRLIATRPRTPFEVQGTSAHHRLEVEPIRVTHSIADATALAIRADREIVVHTGDFKIDPSPVDGEHFDAERLAALGNEGVTLLLSDSTNADSPGSSRSEAQVADALARVVGGARGRVVVALFASNVHRLRALAALARRTGRKVALLGRSVQTHVRVAHETGYLALPPDLFVAIDDAQEVPRHELLVVATGSQAEPRAALSRLALDDHPRLRLEPGDTVILSARAIPGNEVSVMRMVSDLWRRGCEVHIKATDPDIHTSGHAHRDEQRRMIDLVRPSAFVPVHGTRHHLERHAALARTAGVRDVLVVENGEIADIEGPGSVRRDEREAPRGVARKVGTTRIGRVAVQAGSEIASSVLRDRALLAELGVAAAVVVVDARGRAVAEPQVATRGVFDEEVRSDVLADARREIEVTLATWPWTVESPTDDEIREVGRLAVRRALARHLGPKPVGVVLVVRSR